MPEMRHDPIQNRWVIISKVRSQKPYEFSCDSEIKEEFIDPFAEGNELLTPPEVYAVRDPDTAPNTPGWDVRVVPNKYPALRVEGDLEREALGLYDRMNGVGAHEVVIESPDASLDITDILPDHALKVAQTWRHRMIDLMRDMRFKYVMLFRNYGKDAGSSQPHPHTQIVALPVTPLTIATELDSAKHHFNAKERCIFCDLLAQEIQDNQRIVSQNDRFIAYVPYASRFPYEVCLLPKAHKHDFRETSDNDLNAFMALLQDVLIRMKIALNNPPYNLMLHSAPNTQTLTPRPTHWGTLRHDWHWHMEIIPRLTSVAGFEWGTGLFVNPTPPEQAAEILRGSMRE